MAVHLAGINHKTAAVELRELVAITGSELPAALSQARRKLSTSPILLSTCNRTELISCGDDGERLLGWLAEFGKVEPEKLRDHFYLLDGDDAVAHLIEVASGLDSMIFGETQVLGQLKRAVAAADADGAIDPELRHLFDTVLRLAKALRSNLNLGQGVSSPASAARRLARRMFERLEDLQVVLVGAGEIITSISEHFNARGMRKLKILNRNPQRAAQLGAQFSADASGLESLEAELAQADIVISCTDSQQPLIERSMIMRAWPLRQHRPLLLMDLAVPRDIEAACGDLDDIYLYDIDDIESLVQASHRQRQILLEQARKLIAEGVREYRHAASARASAHLIQRFRRHSATLRDAELKQALARLERGEDPRQLLEQLARGLTQKLIHAPSAGLRELGGSAQPQDIATALTLLGLDDEEPSP